MKNTKRGVSAAFIHRVQHLFAPKQKEAPMNCHAQCGEIQWERGDLFVMRLTSGCKVCSPVFCLHFHVRSRAEGSGWGLQYSSSNLKISGSLVGSRNNLMISERCEASSIVEVLGIVFESVQTAGEWLCSFYTITVVPHRGGHYWSYFQKCSNRRGMIVQLVHDYSRSAEGRPSFILFPQVLKP